MSKCKANIQLWNNRWLPFAFTFMIAAFSLVVNSNAEMGFVPSGPPPEPRTVRIHEGVEFPVTYYTEDPQKTGRGSEVDTRIFKQELARGLKQYILGFAPLSHILLANRDNPNFHWIDGGGGAGRAQVEAFFNLPVETYGFEYQISSYPDRDAPKITVSDNHYFPVNRESALARIFDTTSERELTLAELRSAHQVGRFKATNVSFDDVMGPILANEDAKIDMTMLNNDRIQQIYRTWARELVDSGAITNVAGDLIQNTKFKGIEKADLITDYLGALTYAVNKFYLLDLYVSQLKPGGVLMFKISDVNRIVMGETTHNTVTLQHFLDAIQLPGFKHHNGYFSITSEPGTLEMLRELSRRVVKAQVGTSKTYYDSPPGDFLWLRGVKFIKARFSGQLERVEMEPMALRSCRSVLTGFVK